MRAVLTVVLLAGVAGPGCVLDWEEGNGPCGNELLDPGEECDDGNAHIDDGCSASCTEEEGWTCSGTPSQCTATCGDGEIVGPEECDQGTGMPTGGDGCSVTCQIESSWTCSGTPSVCYPTGV